MKKTAAVLLIFFIVFPVFSEQITKVAVLDYGRILQEFYADSRQAQEIEDMKANFAEEVRRLQSEIQKLEERKLDAENAGDSRSALQLDSRIQDKKQYYKEYVRVKSAQIQNAVENFSSSDEMGKKLLREIQYVAESNGFSIVLKKSDNLIWWNYEVDITDLVLERLMNSN